MPYRVTIRSTGRVQRSEHAVLDGALDALVAAAREQAAGPDLKAIDVRARNWSPGEQVKARAELRGPERWRPAVRAGLDVMGDGSVQAWTGAPERRAIEPAAGEDAYAALRRVLTG
jgi:hypothetical protein